MKNRWKVKVTYVGGWTKGWWRENVKDGILGYFLSKKSSDRDDNQRLECNMELIEIGPVKAYTCIRIVQGMHDKR